MLAPLRHRTYRRLFAAQIVALLGTGLLTVALGLLAYDFAGSQAGQVLAVALTIKICMYVCAAPIVSSWFQRAPTAAVLIGADALRIGIALMLPFVDTQWELYAAIAVLQLASATFTPAFQATIPRVIADEEEYTAALSLSRLAYDLEALLSPMLAAAALLVMTYHGLFMGTALGFLGSLLFVASVIPELPKGYKSKKHSLGGISTMVCTPHLRRLLWLNIAIAAPMAMVLVNTVVIMRTVFQRNDAAVAWLLAVFGAGSMGVAFLMPKIRERYGDFPVMWAGAAASISGMVMLYLTLILHWEWLLWIIWPVLGAALSAMQTPIGQILRKYTPEAELGQVFAAQFSLSHACYLVTYPLAGWLGATIGLSWATLVLIIIGLFGTMLSVNTRETAPNLEPVGTLNSTL